jgi:predicted DNA-binding transcriptional regulator YafY
MARNDQVTRVLAAISLLERNPSGFSVSDLHQKLVVDGFECSKRSVYRDLEAIERAHFPVTREGVGEDSRWRLDSIASISRNIQISYRELLALFIARGTLDSMKGSPIYESIQSFFNRIEKALGSKFQEGLLELESYLRFKPKQTWQSGISQEVLDTVHQACAEGHRLRIEYRSVSGAAKGETKSRTVGPDAIYFADAGAYLIAKDLESGQHKTYALARVSSAIQLPDEYESDGFVAKEFLKNGIGVLGRGEIQQVEIQIAEPIASYISERRWHESQVTTRTESGITLRMQVMVNDELARWVLGLGPAAQVIAPSELRDAVTTLAHSILDTYRKGA